MNRCLELASLGSGHVAPNPLVGAVLVHDGRIIGEGYHERIGDAHAEVNAINAVSDNDKKLLKGATLYVNLEPCTHQGRTPPCTDLIIKEQIDYVVISGKDPNPLVEGKGIDRLKENGVKVAEDVLVQEAAALNRRYITFHREKRPYITLKWAQTVDGFIAGNDNKQTRISNEMARRLTHKWRSEEAGIMVGTNTIVVDDPQLNVRGWNGNDPLRITFDRQMRIDSSSKIYDGSCPSLIFTSEERDGTDSIDYETIDFEGNILEEVMSRLYEKEVQSILVEGGAKLLNSFIKRNLWDEARVFTAPAEFKGGIEAPSLTMDPASVEDVGDNRLATYSK